MDPIERIARALWLRDTLKGRGDAKDWPTYYAWYLKEEEKGTAAGRESLVGQCVARARNAIALIEEAGCEVVVRDPETKEAPPARS